MCWLLIPHIETDRHFGVFLTLVVLKRRLDFWIVWDLSEICWPWLVACLRCWYNVLAEWGRGFNVSSQEDQFFRAIRISRQRGFSSICPQHWPPYKPTKIACRWISNTYRFIELLYFAFLLSVDYHHAIHVVCYNRLCSFVVLVRESCQGWVYRLKDCEIYLFVSVYPHRSAG